MGLRGRSHEATIESGRPAQGAVPTEQSSASPRAGAQRPRAITRSRLTAATVLLALLVAVASSACTPGTIPLGPLRLPLHQKVVLSTSVVLELTTLTDSRCPADVQCVWAGELTATVVWQDSTGAHLLPLTWHQHGATAAPDGQHWIALDGVEGGTGGTNVVALVRILDHAEPWPLA